MFEEIKKTYGDPDTYEGLGNRLGGADIGLLIEMGSPVRTNQLLAINFL